MDSDYANVSLTDCVSGQPDPNKIVCNGKVFHVKVADLALKAKAKQFHPGDHVRVDINGTELRDIRGAWFFPANGLCVTYRLLVFAACAFSLLGLAAAVTRGAPLKFIVGMDNRYSNSKFQVALWFWILFSTYLTVVVLRVVYAGWDFFGGVNIPQNLLVLSGLSVLTYGGAKAITTAKVNAAANPAPVAVAAAPSTATVGVAPAAPAAVAVVAPAPIRIPKTLSSPVRKISWRT